MLARHRANLLLAILVCALTLICWSLWRQQGGSIIWPEFSSTPVLQIPVSAVSPVIALPLADYAATWERPLFNPSRQPDPVAASAPVMAPSLDGVQVTGIVLTGQTRLVLIKQGEARFKIKEGDTLPNGWKVTLVGERQVQLIYGSKSATLWLSGTKPKP
ncbi:hypothetical protein [Pseudomonas sp. dw_358]|uniref:hypothetical protein n=1 Tax=Pseudomonas sp. dw_358 TaxID=2720083 RepID=UPI001BD478A0|nr:hypothetical protein [Pseudomonas sp. dw_358]